MGISRNWRKWPSPKPSHRPPAKKARWRRTYRPCLEELENRVLLSGGLDPTFGNGGLVTTDFGVLSQGARAVAIQPDGRIVAGGDANGGLTLARYNSDGTLDSTFNRNGVSSPGLGGTFSALGSFAGTLLVEPSGRIVAGGHANQILAGGVADPGGASVLVGVRPDGTLDPSFGQSGTTVVNAGDPTVLLQSVTALTSQPSDGKLVLVGSAAVEGSSYAFVLRTDADGHPDGTFGGGKPVLLAKGGRFPRASASAVQVEPDGTILVGGSVGDASGAGFQFAVWRLRSDGTPDTGFGAGGLATTAFPDGNFGFGESVLEQPGGQVVVAGPFETPGTGHSGFGLTRFDAQGTLDTTFGAGGHVEDVFGQNGPGTQNGPSSDVLSTLLALPGGDLLAVGTATDQTGTGTAATSQPSFALARYDADGGLVTGFGNQGHLLTPLPPDPQARAEAAALDPQSNTVVITGTDGQHFELARYRTEDPTPIIRTGTTTAVATSGNPAAAGAAITFTATVTATSGGDTPTGTVTFQDGATTLDTRPLAAAGTAAATAAVTASLSPAGSVHTITVTYNPTGAFLGSSGSLTQALGTDADGDGGPLLVGTPLGGTIGRGETDEWTFSASRGQHATLVADPGAALQFVQVRLVNPAEPDPAKQVLAQGVSTTAGGVVTLAGVALPADGTYRLDVLPALDHPHATGSYVLTLTLQDNQAPTAAGGTVREPHGTPATDLSLSFPCSDPDGDPLTGHVVEAPSHGEVTGFTFMQGRVQIQYTPLDVVGGRPLPDLRGPDRFTFDVSDPFGGTSSPVEVDIDVPNQVPLPGVAYFEVLELSSQSFRILKGPAVTATEDLTRDPSLPNTVFPDHDFSDRVDSSPFELAIVDPNSGLQSGSLTSYLKALYVTNTVGPSQVTGYSLATDPDGDPIRVLAQDGTTEHGSYTFSPGVPGGFDYVSDREFYYLDDGTPVPIADLGAPEYHIDQDVVNAAAARGSPFAARLQQLLNENLVFTGPLNGQVQHNLLQFNASPADLSSLTPSDLTTKIRGAFRTALAGTFGNRADDVLNFLVQNCGASEPLAARTHIVPWGADFIPYEVTDGYAITPGVATLQFMTLTSHPLVVQGGAPASVVYAEAGGGSASLPGLFPSLDGVTFEEMPSHGTLDFSYRGDGVPVINYRADPTFLGVDHARYRIAEVGTDDNGGPHFTATYAVVGDVYFVVNGSAPGAAPLSYTTEIDGGIRVPASAGLLSTATSQGHTLHLDSVSDPAVGRITFHSEDGSFGYEPLLGFVGTDTFTFTVVNDVGQRATATATIQVRDPDVDTFLPTAVDGRPIVLTYPSGITVSNARLDPNLPPGAPAGVQFPFGTISFTASGIAPGGSVDIHILLPQGSPLPNQYWKYDRTSPDVPFNQRQWFQFSQVTFNQDEVVLHLQDGGPGDDDFRANGSISDPGAPGFSVPQVAGVALNDGASTFPVTSLTVTFAGVVTHDAGAFELDGPGGQSIALAVADRTVNGGTVEALTFVGAGPALDSGSYTLRLHGNLLHDAAGNALADSQFPLLVNAPPVAQDGAAATNSVNPAGIDIALIAQDAEFDPLTFSVVTPPAHGTLTLQGGVAHYTPDGTFSGADAFVWKANDGHADSNHATVALRLTAAAPPPPPSPAAPAPGPSARLAGDTLVVVGGAGDEVILFRKRRKGRVAVVVNGVVLGTFRPRRLLAVGGSGDDLIAVDRGIILPVSLHGGPGNDVLVGGGGFSLLDGGAGVNELVPGLRRSVLVGGGPGSGVIILGGPGDTSIEVGRLGKRAPVLLVKRNGRAFRYPYLGGSRVSVFAGGATRVLVADASLRGLWRAELHGGPGHSQLIDQTGRALLDAGGGTGLAGQLARPSAFGRAVDALFLEGTLPR